jgi:hypothetical protein
MKTYSFNFSFLNVGYVEKKRIEKNEKKNSHKKNMKATSFHEGFFMKGH